MWTRIIVIIIRKSMVGAIEAVYYKTDDYSIVCKWQNFYLTFDALKKEKGDKLDIAKERGEKGSVLVNKRKEGKEK